MESDPKEESEDSKRSPFSSVFSWLSWFALVLALYVLSFGPAVYLFEKGYINRSFLEASYAPLVYFCESAPSLAKPLVWYIDFWEALGEK